MSFWTPALDPANPLACSQPERYVLRLLKPAAEADAETEAETEAEVPAEMFLGIDPNDQSVLEVSLIADAHHFRTQEAALRAAAELNRLGRGPLDVVKVEDR
jgi:hypothetical protein